MPAREANTEAVGRAPRQPGESTNNLSLANALNDLLGVVSVGTVGTARGVLNQQLAAGGPASSRSGAQMQELLEGLKTLVGRFEKRQDQAPLVAP